MSTTCRIGWLLEYASITLIFRSIFTSLVMPTPSLQALTSIRFFAALWVVLFHLRQILPLPVFLRPVIDRGYVGVSLFFMLSGFILTYNYLPRDFTHADFWRARFARIWPMYMVGLALGLPAFVHSVTHRGVPGVSSALASLTLTQAWNSKTAVAWNAPGWSLSCEVFFYLLFPSTLAVGVSIFKNHPWKSLTSVWLLSIAAPLLYLWISPEGVVSPESHAAWLTVVRFNPLIRFPEFVLGVILGVIYLHGFRLPRPRIAVIASLVAILTVLVAGKSLPYPLFHNGLLAPLFALIIVGLAADDCGLGFPALLLLGEASYSLYIIHSPALSWLKALFDLLHITLSGRTFGTIFLAVSVVASVCTYKLIELPAKSHLYGRRTRRPSSPTRFDSVTAGFPSLLATATLPPAEPSQPSSAPAILVGARTP
jgi:peptidoglycan/LPS O-acetylase OafA/YrhL